MHGIEEASRILDEGTPQLKMQLIKTFGPQMRSILGDAGGDGLDEIRASMQEMMEEMRGGVKLAELDPTGETTDDQNQQADVGTDQPELGAD